MLECANMPANILLLDILSEYEDVYDIQRPVD